MVAKKHSKIKNEPKKPQKASVKKIIKVKAVTKKPVLETKLTKPEALKSIPVKKLNSVKNALASMKK